MGAASAEPEPEAIHRPRPRPSPNVPPPPPARPLQSPNQLYVTGINRIKYINTISLFFGAPAPPPYDPAPPPLDALALSRANGSTPICGPPARERAGARRDLDLASPAGGPPGPPLGAGPGRGKDGDLGNTPRLVSPARHVSWSPLVFA